MAVNVYHYGRWGTATPQQSCTMAANGGIVLFGDRRTEVVVDANGNVIGFVNTTRSSGSSSPTGSGGTRRGG